MYQPNLKSVALPVPEIIGGTGPYGYLKTFGNPWIRRSRSPKVNGIGTNRKRACDDLRLIVRHSNLGSILHRSEILQVFCAPE